MIHLKIINSAVIILCFPIRNKLNQLVKICFPAFIVAKCVIVHQVLICHWLVCVICDWHYGDITFVGLGFIFKWLVCTRKEWIWFGMVHLDSRVGHMIIDKDCSLLNGIKQQWPKVPAICYRCATLIKKINGMRQPKLIEFRYLSY